MNIEERKNKLISDISHYSKLIAEWNGELEKLTNCMQPEMSELYNGIEQFFSYEKSHGVYEHILGGDGRSSAWSEQREGIIAKIKINNGVYLSGKQKDFVKSYINDLIKPNHIEIE